MHNKEFNALSKHLNYRIKKHGNTVGGLGIQHSIQQGYQVF